MGSALVRFSVRQHARPESISKRAQSTTLTSLHLESTSCGRPDRDDAGASSPQPHPSFIEVLGKAVLGDGHWTMEGAGEDGREVTA